MIKLLLATFLFCSSFISFSQTEKQKEMREKYHEAPERVYLKKSTSEENRNNRAVIFYDDFSTPSNWTMTNTSSPSNDWIITDSLTSNLQTFFDPILNSTSGGNFALLDAYSQGSSPQNANLTLTNSINCSSSTNVQLRFENYYIGNNNFSIQVSNDGINFDTIFVNTEYNYLPSDNVEELIIDISATAALQPTVWIRFNFSNIGSFWAVDDIYVEDIPNYNLKFTKPNIWNETFNPIMGSRMDYSIVPVNQIDNLVIGGKLSNYGLNTTTSTKINYSVTNSSSSVIATGNSNLISIPSFSTQLDSAIWNNTTTIGNYTIDYTAEHDSLNQNFSNINTYSESYKVVPSSGWNSLYARDNDIATGDGLWNGDGNGYIMGNMFEVYNNVTAYCMHFCLTQDSDPGAVVCVILYEVDPSTGDFNPIVDQCLDGIEYTLQSGNFSTPSNMNWLGVCLNPASPNQGIQLTQGNTYIAAINHYGGTEQMVIQDGGETVDPYNVFIFDQTDATWYYMNRKPKIRLGFDLICFSGIEENSSQYLSLSQNFPNPSDNETKIDYILEKSLEVDFELVDVTGKLIYSEDLGNKGAGAYSLTLNTENYADGIYFYSLTAGSDRITKKLTISR